MPHVCKSAWTCACIHIQVQVSAAFDAYAKFARRHAYKHVCKRVYKHVYRPVHRHVCRKIKDSGTGMCIDMCIGMCTDMFAKGPAVGAPEKDGEYIAQHIALPAHILVN